MKRIIAIVLMSLMVLSLAACGGSSKPQETTAAPAPQGGEQTTAAPAATDGLDLQGYTPEKPLVLKFAHYGTSETHPSNIISGLLKEKVEAATNGAIQIEIYDNGQLGFDTATFEGVMNGTIDFSINNTFMMAYYEGFEPLQVLDLYYLFESQDHWKKFMYSDVYEQLISYGADSNIKTLGIQWLGFRSIGTGGKPVKSVEDIQGVRLRASTSDVFTALMEKLGCVPVAMAPDEFIPALQNGVVDGTDLPSAIQLSANYTQYYKYYSETNHWAQINYLNTDLKKWNSYSDDMRKIIMDAVTEALDESYDLVEKYNEEAYAGMEEIGIEVTRFADMDMTKFKSISEDYAVNTYLVEHPEAKELYDAIKALK